MTKSECLDLIENECIKLKAIADILIVVASEELERNTLPTLGGIIQDICETIITLLKGYNYGK